MFSRVALLLAIFGVPLMHNLICPVKGQCTVQGCESGDSSISILTEIRQMFAEFHERLQAIDRRSHEQVQSIHEFLNASFQEMKNQQDTHTRDLQAIDRCPQDQVQNIHELLNASFQEMKNQQDTHTRNLQVIDRRSQEQDIYMKQVQSIQQILNTSVHQMSSFNESLKQLQYTQDAVKTSLQTVGQHAQRQDVCTKEVHEILNASIQQMTNQHTSVLRRLDEVAELLRDRDISNKNQSQNSWTPTTGVPLQQTTVTGLEGDHALLPSLNNWTIIMNRFDGSLNFNRSWTEYKNGFGDIGRGEFWLGNEKIHRLTNRSGVVYALRVEIQLKANSTWYYADYSYFSLDSENNKYTLRLSGFSGGNAGDSLTSSQWGLQYIHGGMRFSTWDADNDGWSSNCASTYGGGWWFNRCLSASLTSQYENTNFQWGSLDRLRAARMMISSK